MENTTLRRMDLSSILMLRGFNAVRGKKFPRLRLRLLSY
jgi:hypothetical protein